MPPPLTASIPILDLSQAGDRTRWEARLARLRATAALDGEVAATVAEIVGDVRERGDDALVDYMRRWTDPDYSADRIVVTPTEMAKAEAELDPGLRRSLQSAIDNVRRYQTHIRPSDPPPLQAAGAELGLRFTPVESVGLMVPGGVAVLVSTVIMLAVPAIVAGVEPRNVRIVNPPPTRRAGESVADVSPIVLATCRLLGIETVYRLGGAQAVAALAYGTERVERVAMIAGPGNVYGQLAKQMVNGVCGTDGGFYGPSEIVTVADDSADPRCVAADLIAQAEHDPGKCFLVSWQPEVVEAIAAELAAQLGKRARIDAIARALAEESAALIVSDEAEAARVADEIAAEHVSLAVADPRAWLGRLQNGGEFFLGDQTPVAAGDYYAGPSHCLPTATTARFASGISVYTFLKRSGTVHYRDGMPDAAIDVIAELAELEGLDAHAESARMRRKPHA
jgi:histidinol dehydrogenase